MQFDLQASARVGDIAGLERALAAGADPNKLNQSNGWNALHEAVRGGCLPAVEVLLEHGASVSARSAAGTSTLHFACHMGSLDIAERIVEADQALVHACDHEGWTPLHSASFAGGAAVVVLLLTHGAEVDARNIAGERPLMFAIAHDHCACVALLLAHGALPDAVEQEADLTEAELFGTKPSLSSERRLVERLVGVADSFAPACSAGAHPGVPGTTAALQKDAATSRSEAAKLLVLVNKLNDSLFRSEARTRRYKNKSRALKAALAATQAQLQAESSTLV
jgi:ankyrin repeat protein